MIFLLVTLLAWAILSMGMLGIDWGYTTLSQVRLQAAAQSLALNPLSDQEMLRREDTIVMELLGMHPSARIERTSPQLKKTYVHISRNVELPLSGLLIDQAITQKTFFKESLNSSIIAKPSVSALKNRQFRYIEGTALVELRPARQVGNVQSGVPPMLGAIPSVLEKNFWETLTSHHSAVGVINSLGEILVHDQKVGHFGGILTYIGQHVPRPEPYREATIQLDGYAPIIQEIGTDDRVVGFGHVRISGTPQRMLITMHPSRVGSHNASTQLTGDVSQITHEELFQIFSINQNLPGAILAPMLKS